MTRALITGTAGQAPGRRAPPSPELLQGRTLKRRYQFYSDKPFAETGNSRAFKAYDPETSTDVVVKQLLIKGNGTWTAEKFLGREADVLRNLLALNHPNIVRFVDAFDDAGSVYLVTGLVEGKTLAQKRAAGEALTEEGLMRGMGQLLDALGQGHGMAPRIVHRDVCPQNVLVTPEGDFVLTDYGFALTDESTGTTAWGINSYGFTAPEVAQGEPGTPKSDLFSVGALYLWLKTGKHAMNVKNDDGDYDMTALGLDPRSKAIVEGSVVRQPSRRFDSAAEMKAVLERTAGVAMVQATPVQLQKADMTATIARLEQQYKLETQRAGVDAILGFGAGIGIAYVLHAFTAAPDWAVGVVALVGLGLLGTNSAREKRLHCLSHSARVFLPALHNPEMPLGQRVHLVYQKLCELYAKKGLDIGVHLEPLEEELAIAQRAIANNLPVGSAAAASQVWNTITRLVMLRSRYSNGTPEQDRINTLLFDALGGLITPEGLGYFIQTCERKIYLPKEPQQ